MKLMQKAGVFFMVSCLAFLSLYDSSCLYILNKERAILKNNKQQISQVLPQVKSLKEKKERIQNSIYLLKSILDRQALYLEALAVVSQEKSPEMKIKDLDMELKGDKLSVFLSIGGVTYPQINDFLTNLKKNKGITDAKAVASTSPSSETENKPLDFKLSFEIPLKSGQ